MASLVIVPANEALFPRATRCCSCSSGLRYSPIRGRNQFLSRWSPAAHSLSRLLDQVESEREFENFWAPTLLLHSSRSVEKENNRTTADTDKQSSDKTEENVSPTEEKTQDKFNVSVELGDAYEPSEISVKLVGRCLNIEGKHEEKDDGHLSYRQFSQSFYLSDDVDIENLTSSLSKEGVLSVEAPRLQLKEKESEERNIAIQQTTSPEAVEEKKSEETKDSNEEQKENLEEGESEEAESNEDTSKQPEASGPSGEDK
ncbi:Alpha-crystallin B chain [Holothuria leucospilota]|uniref:Alpha-crystallin B chain n=1 Tax=Holothuria leucospilota TaxID=206669 RepID=A0A9Q0YNQ3_HOLLE|nr:Alpha-crystallin B chain [Holothuria leucospilota]